MDQVFRFILDFIFDGHFSKPEQTQKLPTWLQKYPNFVFAIVAFVLFSRRTLEEVIAFVLLKRCCDQCDCCNDTDARSERNAN